MKFLDSILSRTRKPRSALEDYFSNLPDGREGVRAAQLQPMVEGISPELKNLHEKEYIAYRKGYLSDEGSYELAKLERQLAKRFADHPHFTAHGGLEEATRFVEAVSHHVGQTVKAAAKIGMEVASKARW